MRYLLHIFLGMPIVASASDLTLLPCKEGGEPIKVIKTVPANYPTSPIAFGQDGEVKIEVIVGANGNANSVKVIEASNERFSLSVIMAVKKWEFEKSDKPEDRCGKTKILFKLQ